MKMEVVKNDNHPATKQAKLDLRLKVLSEVRPARVLDLFCGTGEMYRGAWHDASSYVGCDNRPWDRSHPPRFVADNRRLLRCLDLQCYNVFDLDAYGSPWDQLEILAARRRWEHGEQGAIVFTDSSSLKTRWGCLPKSMARALGISPAVSMKPESEDVVRTLALTRWMRASGVNMCRRWEAHGVGQSRVYYGAVVFAGE